MTADERNFRSSYYEKVGCPSVEEKKSLEILLKETPWDKSKLKQFCIRFTIPATYRNILWKVLLGILPPYINSHQFVHSQRQEQYNDLLHALRTIKTINNNTPKARVFLAMFLLETGRLYYNFNLEEYECGIVAMAVNLLDMGYDDVDVYWLARGFYLISEQFTKDMPRLIESTKNILEKEDPELYKFLREKYALENLPLYKWFNCCFAEVLGQSALEKIWDKICGGSSAILSSVAIVLLKTLRRNIMKCKDSDQILKCIHVPQETEEVIANKAIELWQQHGQNDSILNKAKSEIHLR